MTLPTDYSQRLTILLDAKHFTSTQSVHRWMTPKNAVLVSQLCAIVNLVVAQRGLSKAVLLVIPEHPEDHTTDAPFLKDYHAVQEIAKGVLDTMKLTYASLEKGLVLANTKKEKPKDSVVPSLESSKAHVSYCIQFWKSEKIYHPFEINSFVGKIIELYDNNSKIFGGNQSELDADEVQQSLRALVESWKRLSRQVHSHKAASESLSAQSNEGHNSHLTFWRSLKPHAHIFDRLWHVPQVELDDFLHHVPHWTLSLMHPHLPHMPKPSVQLHLPDVLADHSRGLDVAAAMHDFFTLSAHELCDHIHWHDEGINPGTLANVTQISLQKVLKWCSHRCQSPSSIDISARILEVTINYAYAIDYSIRVSDFILSNAYKTLSIHHKGKELTLEDIQMLHDLTVSVTEEEEKARTLFNIVDRDTYKLLEISKIVHEQEKHLVDDRSHEFERNNKALELLRKDVERYIDWWTRASMVLKYEVESCDAAKLNDSVIRRTVVVDKWIEIEDYFMQYPKKMKVLKETFHDLFGKALNQNLFLTTSAMYLSVIEKRQLPILIARPQDRGHEERIFKDFQERKETWTSDL